MIGNDLNLETGGDDDYTSCSASVQSDLLTVKHSNVTAAARKVSLSPERMAVKTSASYKTLHQELFKAMDAVPKDIRKPWITTMLAVLGFYKVGNAATGLLVLGTLFNTADTERIGPLFEEVVDNGDARILEEQLEDYRLAGPDADVDVTTVSPQAARRPDKRGAKKCEDIVSDITCSPARPPKAAAAPKTENHNSQNATDAQAQMEKLNVNSDDDEEEDRGFPNARNDPNYPESQVNALLNPTPHEKIADAANTPLPPSVGATTVTTANETALPSSDSAVVHKQQKQD